MGLYVDELISQIHTVAALYREDHPGSSLTFDNLLKYARDEGEYYRARTPKVGRGSRLVRKTVNQNYRTVTFKEPSSSRGTILYSSNGEQLYQVDGSIFTDQLPSTEESDEPILYV